MSVRASPAQRKRNGRLIEGGKAAGSQSRVVNFVFYAQQAVRNFSSAHNSASVSFAQHILQFSGRKSHLCPKMQTEILSLLTGCVS